jgi:hypothetical protein
MTDTTPGGWPDAARPGYPKDPELDRWHWMLVAEGEPPVAVLWHKQMWHMGYIGMPAWVFANARYLGPCHTPAEVAALTEWRDEPPGGISKGGVLYLSPERVAAQVEAARREEREAAAQTANSLTAGLTVTGRNYEAGYANGALDAARAIRARGGA